MEKVTRPPAVGGAVIVSTAPSPVGLGFSTLRADHSSDDVFQEDGSVME
jgi:hypothetical protein